MKQLGFILIIASLLIAAGCKQESNVNTTIKEKTVASAAEKNDKKGTLMFFMNPNGVPCQIQDKILKSISELSNQSKGADSAQISKLSQCLLHSETSAKDKNSY